MNQQEFTKLVEQGLSASQLADHFSKSRTTIYYWLDKWDLKINYIRPKYKLPDTKSCYICKQELPIENFAIRKDDKPFSYCKTCDRLRVVRRQREVKQQMVNYKGGSCVKCGYNKSLAALEFHHLDPNEKDFNLTEKRTLGLNDEIRAELDKCILVCSNCHRELHEIQLPS